MKNMITDIKQDCLLGRNIQKIEPITSTTIEYYEDTVGNVKVTLVAYNELMTGDFERYIFAGITRNAFEDKQAPPLIDSQFIRDGYKSHNPPMDFKEKAHRFLKYLYEHGGRENEKFELNSTKDFPLAYAEPEEFIRVVEYLEKQNWIDVNRTHKIGAMASQRIYMGVELTTWGMDEIEKHLPQLPLIGLVDQKISTGNIAVDEKINHAKNLFFKTGSTLDDKRSACETLSYVLEPLRDSLATFFSASDVSDFFQIVNRFDIRHNKSMTINLTHEEQLEWIFYTLLNTITTFVKLKKKTRL
ncbi:MAG: hypothetical protein KF687_06340 [Cyclobacteriaceae bacterium]|nr:hypothetical protein [Cyclobacteriaceae bacterium]